MSSAIEVDGAPAGSGESDEVIFREVDSAYFRTAGSRLSGAATSRRTKSRTRAT